MTDVVDAQTRSRMMSGIRGRDTRPEMLVRRGLHAAGFRFRLHAADLAGRPDLVLRRWNAVIFVHGCFWHRHEGCRFTTSPATRPEFWKAKFDANVRRDRQTREALVAAGWRVAVVWECSLRRDQAEDTVAAIVGWLRADLPVFETMQAAV